MKQYKYIVAVAALAFTFTACEKKFDEIPETIAVVAEDSDEAWQPTHGIHEFIEDWDNDETGPFTINPIESPNDIIVRGRIITDDTQGNVYKYIVIQSIDSNHTCLKISIDAGSISGMLPLGQVINVRCNGLILGRYAEAPQLGVRSYRNDNKKREEPGRIPYTLAMKHIQKVGLPEPHKIFVEEMTLKQINALDKKFDGFKIVRIKDAYFTGYSEEKSSKYKLNAVDAMVPFPTDGIDKSELDNVLAKYALNPTFAPSTYSYYKASETYYNIGFPRSRQINDGTADGYVATSEYARFADHLLPAFDANNKGTVTAIVGWYNDSGSDGDWQLTIRSLKDLEGFKDFNGNPFE